ncbi:MAG: CHAT domain-containing protein [Chloracidobacterium sp.]
MRLLSLRAALCGLWLLTIPSISLGQTADAPPQAKQLTRGVVIEGRIQASETHRFSVALNADEVAVVKLNQIETPLNVAVFCGTERHYERLAGWDGKLRTRPIILGAEQPTTYVLALTPPDAKQAGRYSITLEAQRPATAADRRRLTAFTLFQTAQQTRRQRTNEALRTALEQFQQALANYEAAEDNDGASETLTTLGLIYDNLGETQRAIECYQRALPLRRSISEPHALIQLLNNLGRAYDNAGEKRQAVATYRQAVGLVEAIQDPETIAVLYTNLGYTLDILGEKQEALDLLERAITLARQVGCTDCEGDALNNQGLVYESLGSLARAREHIERAVAVYRQLNNRRSLAIALTNLARVQSKQGELELARRTLEEALPLRRAGGDKRGEAYTLTGLGSIHVAQQQPEPSLRYFDQALSLRRETGDRRGEAVTLASIAQTQLLLGRPGPAETTFEQALDIFQAISDRNNTSTILYWLAKLRRDAGDLTAARDRIEQSITIAESLRTKVASQELRSTYFASIKDYYDLYIDILMQLHRRQPTAGFDAQALQVAERARARTLLDLLTEANATVRQGADPELLARERDLQSRLATLTDRLTILMVRNAPEPQRQALRQDLAHLAEDLARVRQTIRERNPRYADLTQPTPPTVAELQQQCRDADTTLLFYSLGETRSYAWAVTRQGLRSFELLPRHTINAAAQLFWRVCQQPTTDPTADGAALARLILAPLGRALDTKRLVIVPDEGLHYTPFAALPDPLRPGHQLVERCELINLPSATALLAQRRHRVERPAPHGEVAILADPVFDLDDPRLSHSRTTNPQPDQTREIGLKLAGDRLKQAAQHVELLPDDTAELTIPRLPGTRREADAITACFPTSRRLRLTDFDANREALLAGEAAKYRILHIASHGLMDNEQPELSSLILSRFAPDGRPQEGTVGLADIFNLPLAAELVVLSACKTGLGAYVRGEGLVGLTRGFMYAGAPQVVVSLWSISDRATARLMTDFYRALQRKQPTAGALRAAQLSLLRDTNYRHPFFWAAFQLQGEWQ